MATIAVVVGIAVLAAPTGGLSLALAGALGVSATVASAAIGVTLALAAGVAMRALGLTPKVSAPSATHAGTPTTYRQTITDSTIVYGRRRVGGLITFYHPKQIGAVHYRYFVVTVAGHRVQGVTRWFLNDQEVSVNGAGLVTSGPYANSAWLWFDRGEEGAAAFATFVAECDGKWTASHRGRGVAKFFAKFQMTDAVVEAGMPNMTCEIDGKDDVYDPRDDSHGYSNNAQLVFYDWAALPGAEGGHGLDGDEIDWDFVAANANVCDETVDGRDGSTEPRYALNGTIVTGAAPADVRDSLIVNCAGRFAWVEGKLLMRPGYWVPPTAALQEEDLAAGITVSAFRGANEVANQVAATYIEPTYLYQPQACATQGGSGDTIDQMDLDLAFTTSRGQAERVSSIMLKRAQAEKSAQWPMNIMGLPTSALDTVTLNTTRHGLSNYAWSVADWQLTPDFSVTMTLTEENEDIYAEPAISSLTIGATVAPATLVTGALGYVRFIYRRAATQPATPATGSGLTPVGWSSDPSAAPGTGSLWMAQARFRGDAEIDPWSAPVLFGGKDGTSAWTAVLSGWDQAGTAFVKDPALAFGSNYVESVEQFAQSRVSGQVTSGTNAVRLAGMLNPQTGHQFNLYAKGSDGGGNGHIWLSGYMGGAINVDTGISIAVGQVCEVAHIGDDVRGYVDGVDVGVISPYPVPAATPLKVYVDAPTGAATVANLTFTRSGAAGAPGYSTATITIYKRSATGAPALPSATGTYTFASQTITGLNNGWTAAIPSGTDPLYAAAATAYAVGATDTIAAGEWSSPVLWAQNLQIAPLFIYQRAASAPSLPSATASYTFSTRSLTGLNNGWGATVPSGTDPLYVSTATAAATTDTDTIAAGEWASAQVMAQNGTNGINGANGYSTATITIYQRAASAPTLPSATTTYTFASSTLTGLNNGWSVSIPAGSDPLYASAATASAQTATDTIAAGEWASPVVLASNGTAGANGLAVAPVYIYQRATSAPALPSATATYTFASATLTGLNNGWSTTIPAGSNPIYVSTATAAGTGATDTIGAGEWATVQLLAQNGAQGNPGIAGIGTLTLGLIGAATFDGSTVDMPTSGGNAWNNQGAYAQQVLTGSVALSYKAPAFYGTASDFFVELASAPTSSFSYSSGDLGAVRFAGGSTGIGSSTSYHTEVWVGGSCVAADQTWDGSATYVHRYDALGGSLTIEMVSTSGTITTLYGGNVGANKSSGLIFTAGNKGRVTSLAFGAAGSNGVSSGNYGGQAMTGASTWNYPIAVPLENGESIAVSSSITARVNSSSRNVRIQLYAGYDSGSGVSYSLLGQDTQTASVGSDAYPAVNQTLTNGTGARQVYFIRSVISELSGSGTPTYFNGSQGVG